MPTKFIGSDLTGKNAQKLWGVIRKIAKGEVAAGREFTTGVTVGTIRLKTFPVDAGPGDPTQVGYVVNVRLIEFPGQPLAVDVLVANQARQLVADAAEDTGTPVLLQLDVNGNMTVIGRSLVNTAYNSPRDYFQINDVDGLDLSFMFGLEAKLFGSLAANIQTALNAYRAALVPPLGPLAAGDLIFIDPVLYVHGENYMPAYIDPNNSFRFGGFGSITCIQTSSLVPWTDPRWQWGAPPTGFVSGVVSWGWTETVTTCV